MIRRSLIWGAAATAMLAALHALSLLGYLPAGIGAISAWLLYPATMLWHVASRSAGFYVPYSAVDVPAEPAAMFVSAWYWLGLSLTFLLYAALFHWALLLLGGRNGAPG
ncbi:MAG: hypothetical protein M3362_02625 [Acidobacteriota bacterium]|nr:hypothetical protein [Acidobacteriota bacterium]